MNTKCNNNDTLITLQTLKIMWITVQVVKLQVTSSLYPWSKCVSQWM